MKNKLEQQLIENCLSSIKRILHPSGDTELKQRDFEYLSEVIFDKSKLSISTSTLRRIFNNEYQTLPQVSTLNALANFLGYTSWNDYKMIF